MYNVLYNVLLCNFHINYYHIKNSFLPKPRNQTLKNDSIFDRTPLISDDIVGPPPYRHIKGFIPRTVEVYFIKFIGFYYYIL